ncbi:hypothetical protein N865_01805 [Intrasporangium oryzae NRRL B-24470]|uniref:Uncharacterized protein n=1 Tax=Intrasporangium oryzae NRRL B-24470 TaxID=1386089 RepID=W9GH15_9MICO|nr:hypothetical protein [Intrasporangium oryzae]EWT03169.1 hypothetical protein N865_01805 [Intrasporangium oryzae NRRL B-24470]
MNDDELLARLRAADPAGETGSAHDTGLADSWVDDLAEAIMKTDVEHDVRDEEQQGRERGRGRAWAIGAAAAAVLAAGMAGIGLGRGGEPTPSVTKPAAVMTLALPGGNAAGMCMRFSVDGLRPMEVALSGTATAVADGSVMLDVDRWYKGGDGSTEVRLTTRDRSPSLEGGVAFEKGRRYLVTATGGQVTGCGFSAEWTPDLAAAYEQAFGG